MSIGRDEATTTTDSEARRDMAGVNDDMNEADVFEFVTDKQPDSPCVSFDGRLFTYREFDEYANRFANAFGELGVRRGDNVALVMRNVPEHLGSILGLMKISAAAVNTNFMYTAAEIANILSDSKATGVVVESEFFDILAGAVESVPTLEFVVAVGEPTQSLRAAAEKSGAKIVSSAEALAAASAERPEANRSGDDRWILYTGGTTGQPKGVVWRAADYYYACLSGGNPYGEPRNSPKEVADNTFEGFRAFLAAPLMHGAGMFTFFTFLNLGAFVALQRNFDPERILRATAEEKAAVLVIVGDGMGVPIADKLREMTDRGEAPDLSGLFMISSGGGIWSAANQAAFKELLPNVGFRDNVGASESGNDGEMTFDEAGRLKLDAARGILVLDLDLEPMQPGTGEVGYIVRTGPLPLEYLGDPEKSARTFIEVGGQRASLLGDMGMLEADGSITFLGRGSGCINTGGEKVFPEEVESTLKLHPAVFDALVVGAPDPRYGESVAAVISVRDGFDEPGVGELGEHVRSHLAGYKAPRHIVVVDEVKRSPAGKADYRWAKSQVSDDA